MYRSLDELSTVFLLKGSPWEEHRDRVGEGNVREVSPAQDQKDLQKPEFSRGRYLPDAVDNGRLAVDNGRKYRPQAARRTEAKYSGLWRDEDPIFPSRTGSPMS